jgi:hypothetical protein
VLSDGFLPCQSSSLSFLVACTDRLSSCSVNVPHLLLQHTLRYRPMSLSCGGGSFAEDLAPIELSKRTTLRHTISRGVLFSYDFNNVYDTYDGIQVNSCDSLLCCGIIFSGVSSRFHPKKIRKQRRKSGQRTHKRRATRSMMINDTNSSRHHRR